MGIDEQDGEEDSGFQKDKSKKDSLSLSAVDRNNSSNIHEKHSMIYTYKFVRKRLYLSSFVDFLGGMSRHSNGNGSTRNDDTIQEYAGGIAPKRGMVLPFTPLAMSFNNVKYFVDMPLVSVNIFLRSTRYYCCIKLKVGAG